MLSNKRVANATLLLTTFLYLPLLVAAQPANGQAKRNTDHLLCPIVIDLDGGSFEDAFTDVQHGVFWDAKGAGYSIYMAWTNPKRKVGFLALDRNGDGVINSVRELFGNLTSQPLSQEQAKLVERDAAGAKAAGRKPTVFDSNGFLALAVLDRPEAGGNGDGKIDNNDAVWPRLRVWIDTCHNADSRCGEMHTLDELGIAAISTSYNASGLRDRHGNRIRWVGALTMNKATPQVVEIYDVFLRTAGKL